MAGKHRDLTGQIFGHLLAQQNIGRNQCGKHVYECLCDCGNICYVVAERLTGGYKTSCGCVAKQNRRKTLGVPGCSYSRLDRIWRGMKFRCDKGDKYCDKHYVERNIKVCNEWRNSFDVFKEWAMMNGYNDTLTLDRIDNYGDYCPDNCRWVTMAEQNRNRTNNRNIEYHGETKTLAEWSRDLDMNYWTIIYRLDKLGMTPDEAFTTPIMDKNENLYWHKLGG